MTTNYDAGRRMEYQACTDLISQHYEAQRTAGSHSPFDVIAWNHANLLLIQVKRTSQSSHIPHAVHEARLAWNTWSLPNIDRVRLEVWVRYDAKWHKFNITPKVKERTQR